jgi:hypothetical protein
MHLAGRAAPDLPSPQWSGNLTAEDSQGAKPRPTPTHYMRLSLPPITTQGENLHPLQAKRGSGDYPS